MVVTVMPTVDPSDVIPDLPNAASPAVPTALSSGGGHVVDPSDVIPDLPGSVPPLPAKYGGAALQPRKPTSAFLRNAAPVAAQTAGQIIGELVGGALAPETGGLSELLPLAMGAAGAGAANVAANRLPEKYGGTPGESDKAAFLWGAVPAGVGAGITRSIGNRMAARATKASAEDAATFAKQALEEAKRQHGILAEGIEGEPPTRASVARAAHLLGSPSGIAAAPLEGEARTAATNEATEAVLGPINRLRNKLGEPIGKAYESLKGSDEPISPEEAERLSDATKSVRDSLIAPAPKAAAIFQKLRRFGIAAPEPDVGSMRAVETTTGGEVLGREVPKISSTNLQSMSPGQISELQKIVASGRAPGPEDYTRILSSRPEVKPPTADELRELRQYVTQRLQGAQGGDVHALRGLQGAIDDVLVDRLPDNMRQLRGAYRGFIKNYPWSDVNKLRQAGTPEQVGDWLFSRNPAVTNEIIRNGTPEERDTYRELFAQNALSKIDPAAPAAEQQATLKRLIKPYLRNNTVHTLYGNQASRQISDLVYMPSRREIAAKALTSAKGQRLFTDGFMDAAKRSGKADLQAAAAGYQKWFNSLPPETQDTVTKIVQPLSPSGAAPTLPSPQESLAQRLRQTKKAQVPSFIARYGLGAAAMSALGAAAGGGGFMERAALGFALMAGGAAGYNALMKAGGADLIAKMYAKPSARFLGAATLKLLANLGGRAVHEAVQPEESEANAVAR